MNIQDVMNADLLTVSPEATIREVAQRMSERNVGAALLVDSAVEGYPGILTERDILNSIAAGHNPDSQLVGDSATSNIVTVSTDSSLEDAVEKMMEGDFRHLLVVHGGDAVGIVSMRDLARALTSR
jgi:CBS domain-containing protein